MTTKKGLIVGSVIAIVVIVIGLVVFLSYKSNHSSPNQPVLRQSNLAAIPSSPLALQNTSPLSQAPAQTASAKDLTSTLNLKTIQLTGKGAQGLDIDPETGHVYVGSYAGISNSCMQGNNQGTSYLNVVDPTQGKEIAATTADRAPIWPAVDHSRGLVYLASSSGLVGVFKLETGERSSVISIGGLPHQPAILGNIMVVSNTYDNSETYYSTVNLDTQKVIGNYPGPHLPHPVIVDTTQKIAYMMGVEKGEVQMIDMITGQPKDRFTLSGGVGQLMIAPQYKLAITDSNEPGSSVKIFDLTTKQLLDRVSFPGLGTPGSGLAVDETDGLGFVVISDHNAIGVFSLKTHQSLGTFTVGSCPYAVRIDNQRNKGYVTNTADGTLTEFDVNALKTATGQ